MSICQIGVLNGLNSLRGCAVAVRILLNMTCVHTRCTDHGLPFKLQAGIRVGVFVMAAISVAGTLVRLFFSAGQSSIFPGL